MITNDNITYNLYERKVVDIIKPITDSWKEVISSSIAEYISFYNTSGVCVPLIDYSY